MMQSKPLAVISFLVSFGLAVWAWVPSPTPGTTPTPPPENETDEQAYRRVCSACHPLIPPRTLNKAQWPGQVEEMRRFSAERDFHWTDEEHEAVLRFLQKHGR